MSEFTAIVCYFIIKFFFVGQPDRTLSIPIDKPIYSNMNIELLH